MNETKSAFLMHLKESCEAGRLDLLTLEAVKVCIRASQGIYQNDNIPISEGGN